jgi:hypothetical protein
VIGRAARRAENPRSGAPSTILFFKQTDFACEKCCADALALRSAPGNFGTSQSKH